LPLLLQKQQKIIKITTIITTTSTAVATAAASIPTTNREFRGIGQANFLDGGSVSGSSQFSKLHQLPLKILLYSKVVKID
jgi:hypothetical protein